MSTYYHHGGWLYHYAIPPAEKQGGIFIYTIYCHIFPNGKRYVGLTKSSLQKRWRNGKQSKPVLQFAKDGTFIKRWANAGEAQRAGIAHRANIGNCCLHKAKYKTVGGYVWEYETEESENASGV